MPSTKISALTNGAPPQQSDEYVVARSGTNRKLTTTELFQETLTLTAFNTKAGASELIPGRTYRVTDVAGGGDAVATADTYSTVQPLTFLRDGLGQRLTAQWGALGLNDVPQIVWDENGQQVYRPDQCNNWPLNNPAFVNNHVDYVAYNYLGNSAGASSINNCFLWGVGVAHPGLLMDNCRLNSTYIQNNNSNVNLYLTHSTFNTCSINDDGQGGTINDSQFENVIVNLYNNPTVNGLRIVATSNTGSPLTSYDIDGAYQTQVVNNWTGTVISDGVYGSSTVAYNLQWDGTDAPGTLNADTGSVNLLTASVVGTYLIPTFSGSVSYNIGDSFDLVKVYNPTSHPVKLQVDQMTGGTQPSLVLYSGQNGLTTSDVTQYHGIATKVHQLYHKNCFVELFYAAADDGTPHWFVKYGAHYDL